jgi:hypothetical protein
MQGFQGGSVLRGYEFHRLGNFLGRNGHISAGVQAYLEPLSLPIPPYSPVLSVCYHIL